MNVRPCPASCQEWELPFLAEPERVGPLRRAVRLNLTLWGLPALIDAAQLCLTELVTNVITHVGVKTPTWVAVSLKGARLRIEVRDPDAGTLPKPLRATSTQETGRGLHLVAAVADQWGVTRTEHGKTAWCELATGTAQPAGLADDPRVTRAGALLTIYGTRPTTTMPTSKVGIATAEETAIDLIADLLHWLSAHGCDPDTALDHAQMHFEAEAEHD
ncbi:Histidine kinase-, DNA gyrase B-, and HSP90-like ATPase [Streptomyces netropsis]|nr:Histidine kinase-, DNA gyrase B-, and HSP90-like ATPase [Streptomyces netropsis]